MNSFLEKDLLHFVVNGFYARIKTKVQNSKTLKRGTFSVRWGLRYYSPELGRWVSRDPIEELGGRNLYAFCVNCPIDSVDILGQTIFDCFKCALNLATAYKKVDVVCSKEKQEYADQINGDYCPEDFDPDKGKQIWKNYSDCIVGVFKDVAPSCLKCTFCHPSPKL